MSLPNSLRRFHEAGSDLADLTARARRVADAIYGPMPTSGDANAMPLARLDGLEYEFDGCLQQYTSVLEDLRQQISRLEDAILDQAPATPKGYADGSKAAY